VFYTTEHNVSLNSMSSAELSGRPETTVKTIDRASRLLDVLSKSGPEGSMLSDVARQTALGKGTTHRILAALVDVGFVHQDLATRRYHLGVKLTTLGRAAHQQDIGAMARPFLTRLAQTTADTVYASVREGIAAVCVAVEVGSFPIRTLTLEVGHRRPLGVGAGSLALLAFLPDAEIDQVMSRNEQWLKAYPAFTRQEILKLVKETRRYGFSFTEGLTVQGMNGIGVPVRDAAGTPVAALSVAAIADRMRGERVSELARSLQAEATELGRLFGGTQSAVQTKPRGRSHRSNRSHG
jgi:DNA-binding IclR family transcriptional regulator